MIALASSICVLAMIAALTSWVGTAVAVWSGPRQTPEARSNHVLPTPISGGLGAALGVAVALIVLSTWRPADIAAAVTEVEMARLSGVFALAFVFALVGAADDVWELGPVAKLALFGAGAALLAIVAGPVTTFPLTAELSLPLHWALAIVGTALWALTVINTVNFMDGANGAVGGVTVLAGVALAMVAALFGALEAAVLGGVVAGGYAGFLPWNTPRARVFMGDTGSLFAGALLVGGGLLMARAAPPGAVYLAAALVMPLLGDALLTLVWRHLHGRPLMRAHADHAYQRRLAVAEGALEKRHQRVSHGLWFRMVVVAGGVVASAVYIKGGGGAWAAIAVLAAAAVLEVIMWFLAPEANTQAPAEVAAT